MRSRPALAMLVARSGRFAAPRVVARACAGFGLAMLVALALPSVLGPARAAEATTTASEENGYARIVLTFDKMIEVDTRQANGILVVRFSEPSVVPVDRLAQSISSYVSAARRDPDGTAIRLALNRRVSVRSVVAGERLFLDLLPENWAGEPPALPADVIEELSRKAQEAERLAREEAARRAFARATPIVIRAARQPTFSRLTFDLNQPVPVSLERKGDSVVINFDAALTADIRLLKAQLPPQLKDVSISDKDARLVVTLKVAETADVRAFWDGTHYVVDLTGPGELPDTAAVAAEAAAAAEEASQPAAGGETAMQGDPPAPEPLPEPRPAEVAPAPVELPPEEPARQPVVAAAQPEPAVKEPAPSVETVPAQRPTPAPFVDAAPSSDKVRPIVQTVGDTVRIAFPFERRTPGAVYRRGDSLWLVFDTDRPIDAEPLRASGGAIGGATAFDSDGARIVKIDLTRPPLTTIAPDGNAWIVSIGDQILDAAEPVELTRGVRPNGRTMMVAELEGVGRVHRIRDTDVGDEVVVVTASAPPRGFLKPQDFVEFRTLVTAHGLAFVPKADDFVVAAEVDRVVVSRDAGLTLTADARPSIQRTKTDDKRIALIDTAQWEKEARQPFRERERELLHAVASATDKESTPARTALARFYMANGFAAEAYGVIQETLAADANAGRDPELTLLGAAAAIRLGRGEAAISMLAEGGLSESADGALWRVLADAEQENWGPAREAFQKGVAAIDLYPPQLQAPFRLAAYEAALVAGDASDADSQRRAFEALGIAAEFPGRKALLDARLADMQGRQAEALEAYRLAMEGQDAVAAAEARLRSVWLRRAMGQIGDMEVLEELETLALVWRGDEIEAQTLRALADEHLAAGRYRDAFAQLKTALSYHGKSPSTRALQDKLTEKFVALFLDGEADSLPPIDALSLFYDYRELTPVDRRGDEMIRKLADRLVEVDLLDQAAELLQHQVDNRLSGAGRAQVAARLALVQLMNRKPTQALRTLASTRMADLPKDLVRARLILEARALAETARPELALEILEQLDGEESARLRADVLWQARRWREAGEAIEALLGNAWEGNLPLDDDQRTQTMRAAIAYSLAEDKIGLDRLRTKFSAKMANSADAAAFETVSAPVEARGTAFRDIAKEIAASDTLDAFIRDYRTRHEEPKPETAPAKPAAAAEAPPGNAG